MSQKYANLPDIDASQDVYETIDQPPSPVLKPIDEEHEEQVRRAVAARELEKERDRQRQARRAGKQTEDGEEADEEEIDQIDVSTGLGVEEGARKWRKRERKVLRRHDGLPSFEAEETPVQRFTRLQQELAELEDHIQHEREDKRHKGKAKAEGSEEDGGIMKNLLKLRERLGKVEEMHELGEEDEASPHIPSDAPYTNGSANPSAPVPAGSTASPQSPPVDIVALDKRLALLERLLGSSSLASNQPHPPPLVSTMTKLESQMSLLTQPRHLDALSRRLKVVLSDLERFEKGQQAVPPGTAAPLPTWTTNASTRRNTITALPDPLQAPQQPTQASLLTFMSRLDPLLPTIPPLLLRLRSLSTLHSSAATFGSRLKEAEEREKAMEQGLEELESAVETMEESLKVNAGVVTKNLEGLESRIRAVDARLGDLDDALQSG